MRVENFYKIDFRPCHTAPERYIPLHANNIKSYAVTISKTLIKPKFKRT